MAKNTVLIVVVGNLAAEAVGVENMAVFLVAGQSAHTLSLPDALEADRTVEVFTFLEENSTIRQGTDLLGEPGALTWVALTDTDVVHDNRHNDEINSHAEHVQMENQAEYVADTVSHSSLRLHLGMCQSSVGIKSVVKQEGEQAEGVHDDDENDNECSVLVISPVVISV